MPRRLSLSDIKDKALSLGIWEIVDNVYVNSSKKLKVRCIKNKHNHEISWNNIKQNKGCPYCNKLDSKNRLDINFIKKNFESEGYKLLTEFYINNTQKLEFICDKGHRHSISWAAWRLGKRCFICKGKKKFSKELVSSELFKEGYILLGDYKNSKSKIKYKCPNNHVHYIRFSDWRRGDRCPYCSRHSSTGLDFNSIKREFTSYGYTLLSEHCDDAHSKLDYICNNGHTGSVIWNNWQQGSRCPKCSNAVSKSERDLCDYVATLYDGVILNNDRSIISPYELDIVIPDKKLAIEYCGLYWHSELSGGKDRKYHLNKLKLCNEVGYRLITIFEDEWLNKNNITKSRLASYFNRVNTIIYARNCIIREISYSEAKDFCLNNHLQGYTSSSVKLGAFYKDELVAVMTFSKGSVSKGRKSVCGVYELSRFCSKLNTRVIGIGSKLLKHFERNYSWSEIFSYADKRWSDGALYNKLNFKYVGCSVPNYWYLDSNYSYRRHRFSLRKTKNDDASLTEWENRQLQHFDRIWDCGNLRYIKNNGLSI